MHKSQDLTIDFEGFIKYAAGEPEFALELINSISIAITFFMARLPPLIASKNFLEIHNETHKVKANFAYMGNGILNSYIVELDELARHDADIDKIGRLFKTLEEIVPVFLAQLKKGKKRYIKKVN